MPLNKEIKTNKAESYLHSLKLAAGGIDLLVNADKTGSFNQRGDIYTLNGSSLKLVNKFTYLRSIVSSTENDINTRLAIACTPIDRWSIIWKSDLYDKIKCIFSKQQSCPYYNMNEPHGHWLSVSRKSLTVIVQEWNQLYWTNPGRNIPQTSSRMIAYFPSLKPSKLDEKILQDTARDVRTNSSVMFSYGPLHRDKKMLDDQLELISNSPVEI